MTAAQPKMFSVERRGRTQASAVEATAPTVDLDILQEMMAEIRALRAEVAELKQETTLPADDDGMARDVRIEIAQMVRSIGRAKAEIAAIKHPASGTDQVETASSQLEAITSTTEVSTNEIMTATDAIEQVLKRMTTLAGDDADMAPMIDEIAERLITIIEACSFHDLTGQRVTQVVKTLRFIESRILAMIDIWGLEAFQDLPLPSEDEEVDEREDAELLNGPALGGQGLSQEDIDALFD